MCEVPSDFPLLPITSPNTLNNCKNLPLTNDIFIASYPKSGTTWTQAIVYHLLAAGRDDLPPLEHISNFAAFFEG